MPGMNSGLNPADPTIVNAFRSALLHQWLIAAAIFVLLLLVWGATRTWVTVQATGGAAAGPGGAATAADAHPQDAGATALAPAAVAAQQPAKALREPRARRLLRIGFGILWVFDGILQAQPKMAAGMPSQVIEPIAANSPAWVQHLVNAAGTIWSYHPVQAGASAVWIQAGIGLWLIVAERGWWSRAAGLASVGWGLVVWVFGESFGGIFAPGLTWLFGAPGAVLLYAVAGALIALPERAWRTPRTGRLILAGTGIFFIGMAVLQAWPGRGFWQGTAGSQPGTLTGMVQSMSQTSQPHALSALVSSFASFTAAHGFAVNLFIVIALAVLGAAFLTGRPRLARAAVIAATVLCLADWVLIEDLGFLGGLGTDPNSMIPMILVFTAGYLALTPAGAAAEQAAAAPAGVPWRERLRPAAVRGAVGAVSARTAAALGAIGVILVGAAPMAAASANRNADPIVAEAISGSTAALDQPAPALRADQPGRQAGHAGEPARQGGAARLPRPGVRVGLPADRPGGPPGRAAPRHRRPAGRAGRDRHQPALLQRGVHPGVRPAGEPRRGAQLAVPDRLAGPAGEDLEWLRRHRADQHGRRDDRAQRHRLHPRPFRAYPRGTQ